MIRRRSLLGCAALLVSAAFPVMGQGLASVDRVAAMVGSRVITQSMVDEALFPRVTEDVRESWTEVQLAKNRRLVLDTLIREQLLFQAALQDTMVKVSEEELTRGVDAEIRRIRASIPDLLQLGRELEALGYRDMDQYRQKLLEQRRQTAYIQSYVQQQQEKKTIRPLPASEREVRATYDAAVAAGLMAPMEPSISFRQLVIGPKPSEASLVAPRRLADSLVEVLRGGADFSALARQFTMDAESRAGGGNLGWHRQGAGKFVREFEEAAFRLKPGEISDPVLTMYGYHIIQLRRKTSDDAQIYHILLMPSDSQATARARSLADSLLGVLQAGASFDSLQALYHDPVEVPGTTARPVETLPPAYAALKTVPAGGIAPLVELPAMQGVPGMASKFAIIRVTGQYPAGVPPYELIQDQLRAALAMELGVGAHVKELQRRIFVDIRMP